MRTAPNAARTGATLTATAVRCGSVVLADANGLRPAGDVAWSAGMSGGSEELSRQRATIIHHRPAYTHRRQDPTTAATSGRDGVR